ncbi:tetratricopeptide repeat protein [Zoogloea oleivorans]|uniref:Tetratricopeptide repeat protein n=1 Tax=Zoogloea oleivorans TaxID=1552750 RepID=A0A6C2CDH1_9RHOO|nr:tetratricopeptide repeat protein [Zoogloea oleivorans]TYC52021.1 tetratricopeptide repeat protein [Zoogloea oleivorans]
MCLSLCAGLARGGEAPRAVGSATCVSCHADEGRRWQASHHAQAMQPATEATVRGDFADARFTQGARQVRFFRRGAGFFIRTEGPDGQPADFQVTHTFGVHPLQQYLIPLPGGRLQAFDIAWDTRSPAEGGQRWFALALHEKARPGEALHWTGRELNWNFMCAGCHSTGVVKHHDPASGHYRTTSTDQAVGCEACHGAGSAHVAEARGAAVAAGDGHGLPVATRVLRRLVFAFDGSAPIARPQGDPAVGQRAGEVCAGCHSRRQQLVAAPRPEAPFLDNFRPALIEPGVYHPDGQIDDEVFEYGSFVQSAMHRAGVTCTHCHDPHDGKPRASGNALCAQCHLQARYDAASHHRHAPGSTGAACTACHMPTKTYMGVHVRHDHRLAVPRPDVSVRLGTPDACTACHTDRRPDWAAAALESWRGKPAAGKGIADLLAALWRGGWPGSALARALEADYPAIQQASVLASSGGRPAGAQVALARAAGGRDGLLRLGAARALAVLPPGPAAAIGVPLLDDPLRAVRIEAARSLAGLPAGALPDGPRNQLAVVIDELLATERLAAERPEAHVNLARLHLARGDPAAAEAALRTALRLDPAFVPALINLADLFRAGGQGDAEGLLRQAMTLAPHAAEPRHALALLLIRQGRREAALPLLEEAVSRAPGNGRYALVAGVALLEAGCLDQAAVLLAASRLRLPDDPDLLRLAARIEARRGRPEQAATLAAELDLLLRSP